MRNLNAPTNHPIYTGSRQALLGILLASACAQDEGRRQDTFNLAATIGEDSESKTESGGAETEGTTEETETESDTDETDMTDASEEVGSPPLVTKIHTVDCENDGLEEDKFRRYRCELSEVVVGFKVAGQLASKGKPASGDACGFKTEELEGDIINEGIGEIILKPKKEGEEGQYNGTVPYHLQPLQDVKVKGRVLCKDIWGQWSDAEPESIENTIVLRWDV